MQVACPDCGKKYMLSASVLGKKVRCKACGGTIETPAAQVQRIVSSSPVAPARSTPTPPKTSYTLPPAQRAVKPAPPPTPPTPPTRREPDPELGEFGAYDVAGGAAAEEDLDELPVEEELPDLPVEADGEGEPAAPVEAGGTSDERSRGVSLKDIRSRHSDLGKALKLYAQVMGTYHSASTAADHCAGCGQPGQFTLYQATWMAAYGHKTGLSGWTALSILNGGIVTRTTWQTLTFHTLHGLCPKCVSVCRLKRIFGNHLVMIGAWVLIIFSLIKLVWALEGSGSEGPHGDHMTPPAMWALLGVGAGIGAYFMPKWRDLPRRLYHIAQKPFGFIRMRKVG